MQVNIEKFQNSKKFNFGKLCSLLTSKQNQVQFAQTVKILPKVGKCEKCHGKPTSDKLTYRSSESNYIYFVCDECKAKISVRANTFMSKSRLSIRKMISMAYWWSSWSTYDQIRKVLFIANDRYKFQFIF